MKPNFCVQLLHRRSITVTLETTPLNHEQLRKRAAKKPTSKRTKESTKQKKAREMKRREGEKTYMCGQRDSNTTMVRTVLENSLKMILSLKTH